MLLFIHRQKLKLLEVKNAPIQPITAEYREHGSLQYEFGPELLQNPVQLLRIENVNAQVDIKIVLFFVTRTQG